jgi:hypothetical protein
MTENEARNNEAMDEALDVRAAAALMQETREHAREALKVKTSLLYAAWGVAWLLGLGAMWLSVRGQQPYRGPAAASGIFLGALLFAAIIVTMIIVIRASKGVGGTSSMQGRIYGLSWPIGFASLFAIEGALAEHGASDEVMGLIGASGPILVTALIYLVASALWVDLSMFALGAWLALVAAVGAWTGPVTVLLVESLAGGGGFLLAAALVARRQRL